MVLRKKPRVFRIRAEVGFVWGVGLSLLIGCGVWHFSGSWGLGGWFFNVQIKIVFLRKGASPPTPATPRVI